MKTSKLSEEAAIQIQSIVANVIDHRLGAFMESLEEELTDVISHLERRNQFYE